MKSRERIRIWIDRQDYSFVRSLLHRSRESRVVGRGVFEVISKVEDGNNIDDHQEEEADEASDKSASAMVAEGLELVTDFVPPSM